MISSTAKREIANDLFKKFHKLNGGEEQSTEYYNKPRMVGIDSIPSKDNLATVDVSKYIKRLIAPMMGGGYMTNYSDKGSAPHKISLMNPTGAIDRLLATPHRTFASKEDVSIVHNLIALHELYESTYMGKYPDNVKSVENYARIYKDTGKPVNWFERKVGPKLLGQHKWPMTDDGMFMQPVGVHQSLGVLGHEANDRLTINKLRAIKNLVGYREWSTEDKLIHQVTGKVPGVDKLTSADIKKLENAAPKEFNNIYKPSEKVKVYSL